MDKAIYTGHSRYISWSGMCWIDGSSESTVFQGDREEGEDGFQGTGIEQEECFEEMCENSHRRPSDAIKSGIRFAGGAATPARTDN